MTAAAELLHYLRVLARVLSEDPVTAVLVAAVAIGVIIGVLARALELRDRRAAEAVAVQGEITDALLREPALLGLPLTPTARVPLWRGSPVTVKVAGKVPSRELRRLALRAAERGAAELLVRICIRSRIAVVEAKTRRTVNTGSNPAGAMRAPRVLSKH